jgi:predicted nucleic-acid-binding protein
VRYVIQDDDIQTQKVTSYIEALTPANPAFISNIVLCELCWVLKSAYGASRKDCVTALEAMLEVPVFHFESLQACNSALDAYKSGAADFSDFLIREVARGMNCEGVKTFDRKALREAGFESM